MIRNHEFDDWLIAMDNKLEQLFDEVPGSVARRLDYSPESLSALESWLLENFTPSGWARTENKRLLDRVTCYVGETFRKSLGGKWTIDKSDGTGVFFGVPVIVKPGHAPECPLSLVTAAIDRRAGNYMEAVLRSMQSERGV